MKRKMNVHEFQGGWLQAGSVISYSGKAPIGTARALYRAVARNGIQ